MGSLRSKRWILPSVRSGSLTDWSPHYGGFFRFFLPVVWLWALWAGLRPVQACGRVVAVRMPCIVHNAPPARPARPAWPGSPPARTLGPDRTGIGRAERAPGLLGSWAPGFVVGLAYGLTPWY